MNRQLSILFAIVWLTTSIVSAQITSGALDDFLKNKQGSAPKAFAELDAYLTKNNREVDNSDEVISLFNQERNRLGANFETELWKYLGKDLNKHYWINSFLDTEEYLNGNKPLPELAKKIRSNAQDFEVSDEDYPALGMKFTILRDVVVDLYHDNNLDSAKAVKKKAQRIYKLIDQMGVVGATTEYIWCVYDNLEKNPGSCKKEKPTENNSGSNSFSGGVLNGKAVNMPVPEYSAAAKAVGAKGTVNVQVVVNENGEVTSAEALSGHALLQDSAVKAAKQAKFQPFLQNGKAVKVVGTIVYNFK